ncbi:MAG: bifunctional diaminohydroxyphosphoribosylaminopyrimidine deaminase/5-amino-6-(5-phosphoribosylamino)uracil reductase RibD [Deltaproteobacteria bacterium]|nr:bifunctional diaminohydroxyphosphoribosylaminopyrimidine deaminase/5-amino-6-(5-phosphoribosylamino)uracil reductase RibD [Deltaproteobacteria bacterium]
MKLALRLAARGAGWVSPNPMVGAVVVKDGQIVGRGFHRRVGAAHAEVEALRQAGAAAQGADLYVTLEPCNHQGRTPPCTQAILAAGVARVIIATRDPNPQVAGGGAEYLKSQGVIAETGVLEAQAWRLNESWFYWTATGRPWVIAKAACSLDGKIATATGESQWLTGEAARAYGHRLRHQVDAILVGIETVLSDDPQLTARLPRGRGKDPIRVVLDSRLRLPLPAKLLHLESQAPTWVACTKEAPKEKIKAIKDLGAEVLVFPEEAGRVPLKPLLKLLGDQQVQSLLVEGGAEVLGGFFDEGLVNQFYFFFAPKILGGRTSPGVLGGEGISHLANALQATHLNMRRIAQDIMISGYL